MDRSGRINEDIYYYIKYTKNSENIFEHKEHSQWGLRTTEIHFDANNIVFLSHYDNNRNSISIYKPFLITNLNIIEKINNNQDNITILDDLIESKYEFIDYEIINIKFYLNKISFFYHYIEK